MPTRIPDDFQPSPDLLQGRTILVTGAGDGIGAAVAKGLAAHGATVVLLSRSVRKLEKVHDEIVAAGGPQPAIYPLNLEKAAPQAYEQLAETIDKEFGCLDGLLHNAGMLGALTPLGQYDLEMWVKVMQVNLHAPFLMTRALLPQLKKSADASVLFTASGVGRHGKAYWGAYSIAGAGVENMMQVLADELEVNTTVRVNSIDPGAVRTTLRMRAYPGEDPNTLPWPKDVVRPYLYLLGPASKGVTGSQFSAQGE